MSLTVAIVPARKGSKRVPRKNVRLLMGKPLIQYSIEHALAAVSINKVVVSTDDEEVVGIAEKFDCEIIVRPDDLATDAAPMIGVIKHCIETMSKKVGNVDYLALLQPSVPIRDIDKIDDAIMMLKETGCDSVISHIRVDYFHPNRMKKIVNARVLPYGEDEVENVSREVLPEAYYRDGSIYAMKAELPMKSNTFFGTDVRAVLNNRDWFINIDEERDWIMAEVLMGELQKKINA